MVIFVPNTDTVWVYPDHRLGLLFVNDSIKYHDVWNTQRPSGVSEVMMDTQILLSDI